MNEQNVFYRLRTKDGLSQDEVAEKVFVTRQAVSRWENGETVPNTETLKLLSRLFNVSINTLLGSPHPLICQCCGMPMDDSIIGKDKDGTPNEHYCQWCYADGTYTYSNMDDLIDMCVRNMVNENFTEEQARAYLKQTLPKLDYWKRYDELSDGGEFELYKEPIIAEVSGYVHYEDIIEGETLATRLRRGPLAPAETLAVLDQLLDAVGYAHARGVVHRDIKPDNIFIDNFGRVKLGDFGIARVDGSVATMGTVAGAVLGTPGYMSPEQARCSPVPTPSVLAWVPMRPRLSIASCMSPLPTCPPTPLLACPPTCGQPSCAL